jgi:hypothetical protein
MPYPLPFQAASINYTQKVGPAYLGIPTFNTGGMEWIPVIDSIITTGTNGTANQALNVVIEGVTVASHNMVSTSTDYYFQDDFPNGFPIYTAGIGAPALTAIQSYTTTDNISYNCQGGTLGADNACSMSWTASNTFIFRYLDIMIDKVGSPTDGVKISIATTSPEVGVIQTSNTVASERISTTKSYIRFSFPEVPIQTSFGQKYYMALTRSQSAKDTSNYYRWYGTNTSGMANGGANTKVGSIWQTESTTDDLNWKAYCGYRVLFNNSGTISNNVMTTLYHYLNPSVIRD